MIIHHSNNLSAFKGNHNYWWFGQPNTPKKSWFSKTTTVIYRLLFTAPAFIYGQIKRAIR